MDIKKAHDELNRLKITQQVRTIEYLKSIFGRHSSVFDISNHFLFEQSTNSLIKLIKKHLSRQKPIKYLSLKNCMLSSKILKKILRVFLTSKEQPGLRLLDIANNRLLLTFDLSSKIATLFACRNRFKSKSLILQGNILTDFQGLQGLFFQNYPILELNMYDTNLSSTAILSLAQALQDNRHIQHLDLGFNSQAFLQLEVVRAFAQGISANQHLESLNLNGNESLGLPENFQVFTSQIGGNRSLQQLKLGSLNLGDAGVQFLINQLFLSLPVCSIDLQNNSISALGLQLLLQDLPITLTSLDLSYNQIKDSTAILAISSFLINTRSLRKLNISHTLQLEELDFRAVEKLCQSLTVNDSLTEFLCEGVKISENPDEFCIQLNEAIRNRKLSLTYKISAVNCFSNQRNTMLNDLSRGSPLKLISNRPSESENLDQLSNTQTERREFSSSGEQNQATSRAFQDRDQLFQCLNQSS